MACFSAGPWAMVPGHGGLGGVHGLPLNSSWTAWMSGGLPGCPVSVQTSCVAICARATGLALAAAPVRSTVAVGPSTVTLTFLAVLCSGNAVTAGGVGLTTLCSHFGCGLFSSARTR